VSEFTLRIRRYDPEAGTAPYWDQHTIDLEPHRSVLEGILQAKARFDGSIGIRCSCKAAICGSCGVRINGQPGLACHTHLDHALRSSTDGVIEIEPMGNMPVIKDLIVDMDAVHWKKVQRVTPWLINKEPVPEREYIVPHENMVDITQSMACIQCGACVSDCLSMEVDPLFIGPAALAKAYRFVGDPRDAQQFERLKDLAEDPHGIFDCTHCFKCIEACPKGVAPMSQIMRLRRVATGTHDIEDRNNGARHESAFVSLVKKHGLLWEAELLPRSYGGDNFFGKFAPKAGLELLDSLPVIAKGLLRRKVTPAKAIKGPGDIPREARAEISRIFDTVHGRDEVRELNLYISGYDEDLEGAETPSASAGAAEGQHSAESGQPGMSPEESPTR
jgi:succinate dehydrogenase / fumarate reductase iron-sulfur subunit